jgi:hypothetical protein
MVQKALSAVESSPESQHRRSIHLFLSISHEHGKTKGLNTFAKLQGIAALNFCTWNHLNQCAGDKQPFPMLPLGHWIL